ncbi:hypothetical protein HOY80DRAFT_1049591 [Tuber brumale]|nr:hypothetical protein HOY80DRAFT_1049591 [Tuber brumale]
MRFATRREDSLPEGIIVESIKVHIKVTQSNCSKVRGITSYVKVANIRAHVGCIFLSLANHSASELRNRLDKAKVDLLCDLNVPEFEFQMDVKKAMEASTSNRATDCPRHTPEASDPGLVTAACPKIMGSIHGMRQVNACTCATKVVVQKTKVIKEAPRSEKIFLHSGACNVIVFTDNKPAKVLHVTAKFLTSSPRKMDKESPTPEPRSQTEEVMPPGERNGGSSRPRWRRRRRGRSQTPRIEEVASYENNIVADASAAQPKSAKARDGLHVPMEANGGDMFSFVKVSSVQVFVLSYIWGLFEVIGHGDGSGWIGYWKKVERPVVVGIDFPPTHTKSTCLAWFVELRKLGMVLADFNPRHIDCDPNADRSNGPRKWLREWPKLH